MKKVTTSLLFSWLMVFGAVHGQTFEETITTAGRMEVTFANNGVIGNSFKGNFQNGFSSAEYPKGSGTEHIYVGGLWVGGINTASLQPVVSSAYIDAVGGYGCGTDDHEFFGSPNNSFVRTSNRASDPDFAASALSTEDIEFTFNDTINSCPGTSIPVGGFNNSSMGLEVKARILNWDTPQLDDIILIHYQIKNIRSTTYDSTYIALLINDVVRNTKVTPVGAGGTAFYNKGGNGYLEDQNLAYAWDVSGDPDSTGSYLGIKALGFGKDNFTTSGNGIRPHYNTWVFQNQTNSCYSFPGTQVANASDQYEKLTVGLNDFSCWDSLPATCDGCSAGAARTLTYQEEIALAGNRSNLLSMGPVNNFAPGDTIEAAFALVFAPQTNLPASPRTNNPDSAATRVALLQHANAADSIFQLLQQPLSNKQYLTNRGEINSLIVTVDNAKNLVLSNKGEQPWIGKAELFTSAGQRIVAIDQLKLSPKEESKHRLYSVNPGIYVLKAVDKNGNFSVKKLVIN